MWRKEKGGFEKILETFCHDIEPKDLWKLCNDPLSKEIKLKDTRCLQTLANLTDSESLHMIYIESVMLRFAPNLSHPEEQDFDTNDRKSFIMYVRDVPLVLEIINTNELLRTSNQGEKRAFLPLARNTQSGWIEHFLPLPQPAWDFFRATRSPLFVGRYSRQGWEYSRSLA